MLFKSPLRHLPDFHRKIICFKCRVAGQTGKPRVSIFRQVCVIARTRSFHFMKSSRTGLKLSISRAD